MGWYDKGMELLHTPESPTAQETAHDTAKHLLADIAIWSENPALALEAKDFTDRYEQLGADGVSEMDAVNLMTDAIDIIAA